MTILQSLLRTEMHIRFSSQQSSALPLRPYLDELFTLSTDFPPNAIAFQNLLKAKLELCPKRQFFRFPAAPRPPASCMNGP